MPRGPRERQDGDVYHVMARGNNKENIFREVADYDRYVDSIRRFKPKIRIEIYCFVLMPNHIHFLLKAEEGKELSRFMHLIQTSYSIYFNHKYSRVGHLFQGRFKRIQGQTLPRDCPYRQ